MVSNSIEKIPEELKHPKEPRLLGDIDFLHNDLPLGGLNPFNKYFDIIGQQFVNLLINNVELSNNSKILDVGCGTGRIAKCLYQKMDVGLYQGYDINQKYIDYCKLTYPLYDFDHFDIQHDEYNSLGTFNQNDFILPYQSNYFDIIIILAVINHLHYSNVVNLFNELSRVIKRGGYVFSTHTILNNKSIEFINNKTTQPYLFTYKEEHNWYDYESRKLINVAHHEIDIRRLLIKNRLMIREPIRYGQWCGSPMPLAGPDIIIAVKH